MRTSEEETRRSILKLYLIVQRERLNIMICVIEGNIGAGKSSLLNELARRGYSVFKESLNDWKPFLDLFYADPKRWGFTLQLVIMKSLKDREREMARLQATDPYRIIFTERSPAATLKFINLNFNLGYITSDEEKLLYRLYTDYAYQRSNVSSINLYLDVPVETCYERLRKRDRSCERGVDLDYLKLVDEQFRSLPDIVMIDGMKSTVNIANDVLSLLIR